MEMERKIGINFDRKDSIYGLARKITAISNRKNDWKKSNLRMGKEGFIID